MNKKIIAAVLMACLSFNALSAVGAAGLFPYDEIIFDIENNEEIQQKELESAYLKEVETIIGFGWMNTVGENDFNSEGLINGYDMYEALMNMIRGTDSEKNIYVSYDNVTFEQLADAFINNLSLSVYTDETSSFFATAVSIGLFKGMSGISQEAYVTREQLAKALYNALFLQRYELVINGEKISYVKGDTVLESMGIEIIEGVVTGNEYIDFYENMPLNEGYASINRFKVNVGETDICNMLGKRVTAYVENLEEDPTLIYVREEEKSNVDFKFETDDYISCDSGRITFYDSEERERRVKVNPQARVIYNGRYYGQYLNTDVFQYADNAGFIQTIETGNNGEADIVLVTVYETYVVESIYKTNDDFIINNLLDNKKLKYNSESEFCFIKNGTICSYNDINANDVLYVSESADKKTYIIYVSDKKLNSEIISVTSEEITLKDGNKLKISKNFKDEIKLKPVDIYLGYDGKLAYIKYLSNGNLRYGYIMSMTCDTEENENGIIFMKVYTMNGEAVRYESLEKIKFTNGAAANSVDNNVKIPEGKKYAKDVYNVMYADGVHQLVQFALNSDNKITHIVTAMDTTATGKINEDVFSKDYSGGVRTYNMHMGSRFKRTGNMQYMQVPADKEKKNDEKYYSIKSISGDGGLKNAEFYDASVNGNMQNGIVIEYSDTQKATIEGNSSLGIITKNKLIYSEADEEVQYQITLISRDGLEKSIIVNPDNLNGLNAGLIKTYADVTADKLKAGDVIFYNENDIGEMTAFSLEVRCNDEEMKYFESIAGGDPLNEKQNFSSRFTTLTEVVGIENDGSNVIFSTNNRDDKNLLWNRCFHVRKAKQVLIYDTKSKNVTVGTGSDILKGDKIYIQLHYEYITQTYIVIR